MDILQIIKHRKSIRRYKNKKIPRFILNKIIEGGIWGPSLIKLQPWKFIVIEKKIRIEEISNMLNRKSQMIKGIGPSSIMKSSANVLRGAQVLIAVYNDGSFANFSSKFGSLYVKNAKIAEISAISSAIQNMLLVAESLGVGSCWLDIPLFCEKSINNVLHEKGKKLIAMLALGFPDETGARCPRKAKKESIKFM